MRAEHRRPLVAFVVVSATSAMLLSQALVADPDEVDRARPAASQTSGQSTSSPSSPGSPSNGHAVAGVTASPSDVPVVVKTIGRTPTLMAIDDGGLGVSVGAVHDPDAAAPPKDSESTSGSSEPSTQPDPTSTGEPDPDAGGSPEGEEPEGGSGTGGHGPKSTPPAGPWSSPGVPPIGPGNHASPSGSSGDTP